ncbi:MAG TPA: hypothetical protein VGB05_05330 [Pyrinomonadaceae bacterium]|jgi:hypothetical protein
MDIIVGCEYTQEVCQALRAAGHNAYSCDILPTEGDPRYHLQCDVFEAINSRWWDAGIFFPDCTFVCSSGLHWCKRDPTRAAKRDAGVEFARRLMEVDIEYIALENPIGCLSTRIRKPDQIIQPYEFGEDASKATCLWLKNLPKLKKTKFVEPRMVCTPCGGTFKYGERDCPHCWSEGALAKPRWANQTDGGQNRLGPSETRGLDRARTYPGVAAAMATQWFLS